MVFGCGARSPLSFFFFNDTATTEIYTLSLHDALPISHVVARIRIRYSPGPVSEDEQRLEKSNHHFLSGSLHDHSRDRKSTRLNSSHLVISYAVFCLKKKKSVMAPICSPTSPCLTCITS